MFALKIRKRFKLYFCCLQVYLTLSKVIESNASSYFFITNIEINFQILRLFERKTNVFVQKIILVKQMICFVSFASY